jgi:hypothetical protein
MVFGGYWTQVCGVEAVRVHVRARDASVDSTIRKRGLRVSG